MVSNEVGGTFGSGVRIPYENIITNRGGDYSAINNEYICPTTGFYLFSATSLTNNNADGEVVIMMNDGGTPRILASAMAVGK